MKTYKDYEYIIFKHDLVHMWFYCAYVRLPDDHPYQKLLKKRRKVFSHYVHVGHDDMDISVHGGLTFGEKITRPKLWERPRQGFSKGSWIGWDYGHLMDDLHEDYTDMPALKRIHDSFPHNGHNWTEEEVEKDCKSVINQLTALT